jgi:hypothetical protein
VVLFQAILPARVKTHLAKFQAQFIPIEKGGHLALMMNINAGAREKLLGFLEHENSR